MRRLRLNTRPSEADREGGFALLIVLWSLVLLSLLIAHIVGTARSETRIAINLKSAAAAEAAADGAAYTAIFRLLDTSPASWAADGEEHRVTFGAAIATVRAVPLSGKINPNFVSKELMAALLRVLGTGPAQAETIAAAITQWGGRVHNDGLREERMAPYRAAGLDHGPPLTPFESIEELGRIQGMTPELLAALAPHLSLHRLGDPDPAFADPEVRQALQLLSVGKPLPPAAPPAGGPRTQMVEVEAAARAGDARFTRRAVVSIDPSLERGYAVLSWEDGQ